MTNITDTNTAELDFGVLYIDRDSGRHPEDGSELVSQDYYIVATGPEGDRWLRYVGVWGWDYETDDDGFPFMYRRGMLEGGRRVESEEEIANVAAEVATRLQESDTRRLNPEAWVEWQPVYGSNTYQMDSWEERNIHEEREAERWG